MKLIYTFGEGVKTYALDLTSTEQNISLIICALIIIVLALKGAVYINQIIRGEK